MPPTQEITSATVVGREIKAVMTLSHTFLMNLEHCAS